MALFSERDFRAALEERLSALVASEFTTLSVCNLVSGKREVLGMPRGALSADDRAAFKRHVEEHPLVRFHAYDGGRVTQRISGCLPTARFRETPLFMTITIASA